MMEKESACVRPIKEVMAEMSGVDEDVAAAVAEILSALNVQVWRQRDEEETIKGWGDTLRCNGHVHKRGDGRLYAHHSTGANCPYPGHGGKKDEKRGTRRYIRQEDVSVVMAAMETWKAWRRAKWKMKRAGEKQAIIEKEIKRLARIAKDGVDGVNW